MNKIFLCLILFLTSCQVISEKKEEKTEVLKKVGMESLSYYRIHLKERYQAFKNKNPNLKDEEIVTMVNLDLDMPIPDFGKEITTTIDKTTLVNKRNALPKDYEPKNLVPTPSACIQGVDYSCQSVDVQLVNEEVAIQFEKLVKEAEKKGFKLKAIASYRSIEYQKVLFNYGVQNYGLAYAQKYYAIPGQSEHNLGYAQDWTIDETNFDELDKNPNYPWLLENAPKYGFILRYAHDKKMYHEYEYESWHFRYVGIELATHLTKNNLSLEEYYGQKP